MAYKYKLTEQERDNPLKPKDVSPQFLKRIEDLYGEIDYKNDFFSADLDTYFKTKEVNKETGSINHAVIKLASVAESLKKMQDTIEAFKDLLKTDEVKKDQNIQAVAKDVKEALNKYRAHLRKFYPEQYKQAMDRISEGNHEEVEEISLSNAAGAYNTPYAFRKKGSKPRVGALTKLGYKLVKKDKDIDEGTCGYDRDINGKKLKGPGGLGEALSYAFSEYDFIIKDDAYKAEVEAKIKKELKKIQSEPLEIPEKDLQAIIKNAENYFSKEARKEEKANRNPRKIKSTEFAQFAADYYTEEYYPENYGKDYPDKRPVSEPVSDDEEILKSFDGIDVPSTPEEREIRRRSKLRLKYGHAAYFISSRDLPKDLFYSMPKDEFDKTFGRIVDEPIQNELIDGNIDILFDKSVNEVRQLVHVYDKDGSIYGTGEVVGVDKDKTIVRFDGQTIKRFPDDRVEPVKEGDTYEKMAAKGKKAGNLKQGTVRKRLGIKKGEKIPLSLINKEISRLKKMDKDKDKKGVQLGDKNQKYYKALQLSKTLKTTTNVNEEKSITFRPGALDDMELSTRILDKEGIKYRVNNYDLILSDDDYLVVLDYLKGRNNVNVNLSNSIINENSQNPGAKLGPGPKAGPDGVTDNYYVKAFKYRLVPKKDGTYVQKGSGLDVKKLF